MKERPGHGPGPAPSLQSCLRPHRASKWLCLLLVGHSHLQPAALLCLLHHYEGTCALWWTLCAHACINIYLQPCCLFSCGVARESSVCRWCVFSSRLLCGALRSISSSRVSAPGRSVLQAHAWAEAEAEIVFGSFAISLRDFRKRQPSLGNTTETASCFPSLTTTTSGTSSPPSPCLDPSWYAQDSNIRHFTRAVLAGL